MVLTLISGAEGYSQSGPDGLLRASVQVDVYGPDHAQVVGIAHPWQPEYETRRAAPAG